MSPIAIESHGRVGLLLKLLNLMIRCMNVFCSLDTGLSFDAKSAFMRVCAVVFRPWRVVCGAVSTFMVQSVPQSTVKVCSDLHWARVRGMLVFGANSHCPSVSVSRTFACAYAGGGRIIVVLGVLWCSIMNVVTFVFAERLQFLMLRRMLAVLSKGEVAPGQFHGPRVLVALPRWLPHV